MQTAMRTLGSYKRRASLLASFLAFLQTTGRATARALSLTPSLSPALAMTLALALGAGQGGCSHPSETGNADVAGEPASAGNTDKSGPPIVVFEPPGRAKAAVLVEVVRTPEAIQRGLMYREEMDEDRGMLFLMPQEEVQSFWMRNTYIALDMIFVGRDKVVVGVVEDATPMTDTGRTVGKPSLYVVEVNAGWAKAHGVTAGVRVRFKNVPE